MRTFKEQREMPRVAVCKERWAWMSWRREEAVSEPWVQEVLWLPPLDEQSWLVSQARCWEGGSGFGVDSPRFAPRLGWVVRNCL